MKIKSQESRVKSRTMRCVAFCLALAGPSAFRSHAQCYIDPATGRQVCADAPEALAGARAPALDSRPSALDSSGHCRVSVGDGSAGSGTLVAVERSIGIVLTCSHLFDGAAGRIVVSFRNGERFGALLIERDRAHDLAALAIRRPSLAPVEVSGEEPAGALLACGYGPNGQFRCMRGNIIGRATATGAVHPSLTLSFAVRPGDSGGAVLNERDQLVGVIWGQRDGLTYATCGRPVREFLDGVFAKCAKSPGATPQIDWQARLDHLQAQIRALEERKQDKGDYVQSRDLMSVTATIESVRQHVQQIVASDRGVFRGLSLGKLLAGALGLSGPPAVAVILASALVRRRWSKRGARSHPEGTRQGAKQLPIAVDSPPPAQRTVPETHYVPVESDSFAKAHQWASEHVARKYPGATEILQAQDSLIKQYLAAK